MTPTTESATVSAVTGGDVTVRRLEEPDLPAADRVFRLAFGTMLGLPEPTRFAEGAELLRCRFAAGSGAAFAAEVNGEIVGTASVTRWGSFAIFGPLAIHPTHWDSGIGQQLWAARLPLLDEWGVTHASLFTAPQSTKHLHLYQKFGFWPRFLTALTAKPVPAAGGRVGERFSELAEGEREELVERCRALTDAIYPGLDVGREIRVVAERAAGDVVYVLDDEGLAGFAVCHAGEGSEAVPGTCFVKFAAARPGAGADTRFDRLLEAVEQLAATSGLTRLEAGVNLARRDAFRVLAGRGYRPFVHGVAMHRPDEDAYDRPDVYLVDDRR